MFPRLSSFSTLQWAVAISLAFHALLLTLRFADPAAFDRLFEDNLLEVVLVNARSTEAPAKAQAVAQAALAGGGEAEKGRATSPLPASVRDQQGDASEDAFRRIEELQEQQHQLLAQVRQEVALLPPPDPRREQGRPEDRDTEERRRQLMKLLAEIEKRIQDENARPKKRYISPATRQVAYAMYYDQLRRKVEDRGTRDFPQANGQKLYGELTMNITVDNRGRLVETQVIRPSKSKLLDKRALAIVQAAAPFGAFTPEMRREADQIVITSRFRFSREEGFETTLSARERPQ
jgi:periplasmic protein TonB